MDRKMAKVHSGVHLDEEKTALFRHAFYIHIAPRECLLTGSVSWFIFERVEGPAIAISFIIIPLPLPRTSKLPRSEMSELKLQNLLQVELYGRR